MCTGATLKKFNTTAPRNRLGWLLAIYYAENNLAGSQQNEEPDPKQLAWDAIVPGTQSEIIFHWACGAGSTGARPG